MRYSIGYTLDESLNGELLPGSQYVWNLDEMESMGLGRLAGLALDRLDGIAGPAPYIESMHGKLEARAHLLLPVV